MVEIAATLFVAFMAIKFFGFLLEFDSVTRGPVEARPSWFWSIGILLAYFGVIALAVWLTKHWPSY